MGLCDNCKYYRVCGDDDRIVECKVKEMELNIQQFGGRGASSSSNIGAGSYTYNKNGNNLSVKVIERKGDKLLVRVAGKGSNGAFFDGSPQTISINSPLAKGMKRK